MAAVVWVVSGVIQTTKKHESVDPLCSDLQLRIADKCSHILDQEEDGSKVCHVTCSSGTSTYYNKSVTKQGKVVN